MTDTTALRARLEEEKARLEKELETVGRRNPSNPADWEATNKEAEDRPSDPADLATVIDQYSENTSILNDLETRYNEVANALAHMEAGTYGTCRICGKEIEEDRLNAEPAADTCKEHRSQ
ncbi:MAG TPA: TraR/DksA C4-type zinc finger protein [Candidatus Paceibacterota bacterium]|jgi:RNA polymerase-binding transcription factor DksA